MNIDIKKLASVLSGEIEPTNKVGWCINQDGSFSNLFVAFNRENKPVTAKDGSIKLNVKSQTRKDKDHAADVVETPTREQPEFDSPF